MGRLSQKHTNGSHHTQACSRAHTRLLMHTFLQPSGPRRTHSWGLQRKQLPPLRWTRVSTRGRGGAEEHVTPVFTGVSGQKMGGGGPPPPPSIHPALLTRTVVRHFLLPRSCRPQQLPRQLYLGQGWADVAVCACARVRACVWTLRDGVCVCEMEHLGFLKKK